MASIQQNIARAQSLPPQLLHFFKRWRPPQLAGSSTGLTSTPSTITISENTSSSDPNVGATTTTLETETSENGSQPSSPTSEWKKNPFLPFKNHQTGNWHGPHYSLRRQADLYKLARSYGVLSLMPISPKHPEVKEAKRIEHGLRVKGTGVGQRVKGKLWERTLRSRLDMRTKAMENMPDLISLWRLRGHGKGWKKFPKGKPSTEFIFDPKVPHLWANGPKLPGKSKGKKS